ncbi:MAG: hypothetical protein JEZ07_12735 [Phycisphaerae bacterium]|nr:hypothetical protein [Phycisphaerae bacterium]
MGGFISVATSTKEALSVTSMGAATGVLWSIRSCIQCTDGLYRIVSIAQPHIKPIVHGKARTKVEFDAKVYIILVDDVYHCDTINFDSYNESTELIDQIKSYKKQQGYYLESVHADQIYRISKNRKFCQENDIRLSGPFITILSKSFLR